MARGILGAYQISTKGVTVQILSNPEENTPYVIRQVGYRFKGDNKKAIITSVDFKENDLSVLRKGRHPQEYMPIIYPHLSVESRHVVDGVYAESVRIYRNGRRR